MTCGIAVGSPQKASMSRIIQLLSLLMIATAAMAATTKDGGPELASTPATVPGVPGGAPAAAPGGDAMIFIMIGGMILFMWLLVIRPQKKEEKRRKALIDSMKPGHQVVTIGGVHGEVVTVGELTVELNVTKGDKPLVMTFNRGAIATNVTLIAADAKPAK
jgi:preprotein translocase subunit YajC